jgi:hypothetical protein
MIKNKFHISATCPKLPAIVLDVSHKFDALDRGKNLVSQGYDVMIWNKKDELILNAKAAN